MQGIQAKGHRRRQLPKFQENIISDDTKWIIDHADFTGLMNEFKFDEKVSKTQRQPKNKQAIIQFFNYIADNHSVNESSSDFETTCKIKDEDKMITAKPP